MSKVIPFRPSPAVAPSTDIAALSARLFQVESAETSDEDLLDLLLEAETAALDALSNARAVTLDEVALKLATLVRRVGEDQDGPLCEGEVSLLHSALRDLQRLAAVQPQAATA